MDKKKTWDKTRKWEKELEFLKSVIIKAPLQETVKWGAPVYTYNGKNIVAVGGYKSYFGIWFYKGVFLKDEANLLINAQQGTTKSLRQWRFNNINEIDENLLLSYINEAIEIEKAGLEIKPEKKQTVVPDLLQNQLDAIPELYEKFKALTPFKQREYCEYVDTTKREITKLNRLKKIKPLILQGLGLNDKYR